MILKNRLPFMKTCYRFLLQEGKTILISSHQLSEIEQLVDTIGVLHDTRLVEECDMQDIMKHNQRYINVGVSDVNKACILLEQKFGIA